MATVELTNLCKRYGSHTALHDLNLTVEDGEFLVLLGPSGCGKSTTMRMIAGLDLPTQGNIYIAGKCVNHTPARDRNLAMVFQNYALYPHMTVGENIGYPLKIQKVPRQRRQQRVDEAADMVDLGSLLSRKPAELSGGQRQRVALARAVIRRPQLFLMDEPLSNLDAKLRSVMRAELGHLQQTLGTTTIYVTHDQVEAMTLAHRIVILNNARIQQAGSPREIYNRPNNTFVAGFMGSPPMNLIDGEISEGRFHHTTGSINVNTYPEGPITLGIRPEHIHLTDTANAHLQGSVYASELLGDSTILNVRSGDSTVLAKVAADQGLPVGERVSLAFDPGRIMMFDSQSGERID